MLVTSLWQYPVKGLHGSTTNQVRLEAGGYFPGDRLYAVGNGHEKLTEMPAGSWMKKAYFIQLMKFEQLAALGCHFEQSADGQDILRISRHGEVLVEADLTTNNGTAQINAFFGEMLGDDLPGTPQIMRIAEGAYTDTNQPWISIGGSASLDAFAAASNTDTDARRFRLNIILETATPFEEAGLIGKTIQLGEAQLTVVQPVGRCAAIDVNPETAKREPNHLALMQAHFGHTDLGVFAEITRGGIVRPGDQLTIIGG